MHHFSGVRLVVVCLFVSVDVTAQTADQACAVPAVATGLGLSKDEASQLVERMPVLLAYEAPWLKLK
jgi:hypothetical protein